MSLSAMAQLQTTGHTITNLPQLMGPKPIMNRSIANPTQCDVDTANFPAYGSTAYNTVTIGRGQSLGQFFNAPQDIKIYGFRFYGFAVTPNPVRNVRIRAVCNVYRAGTDSLPSGSPVASDTVFLDTVGGASIPLDKIQKTVIFKNPITVNYNYILVVECDSQNVRGAVVTNNWNNADGKRRNIGCGSVSGRWYRNLNLNISGVTFDAHMQFYPIVSYKLGVDYKMNYTCYPLTDTVRFSNDNKSNVTSSIFYNYYVYINFPQFSHRWNVDNTFDRYSVDYKWKYLSKQNYDTRLISTVYQYDSRSFQCNDTQTKKIYFQPQLPTIRRGGTACKGDSTFIELNSDVPAKWFKNPSDTIPVFVGNFRKFYNVQSTDSFYVKAENSQCTTFLAKVMLRVYDYPQNPIVRNDSICSGAVANLSASTNLGRIEWFADLTGGKAIHFGNNLQTGKLTADSFLFVQANNNGCINKGGRVLVAAYVSNNFAPSKPVATSDTFACLRPSQPITLSAMHSNSDTLRWYDVPFGGNVLKRGDSYTWLPNQRGEKYFYVESWNGVCGSGRLEIKVNVYDYSSIFGNKNITICTPDTAKPFLSATQGNVNWYSSKNMQDVIFVGSKPSFADLKKTTKIYLKTDENGCFMPNWDSCIITVNSAPLPTTIQADAVCSRSIGFAQVIVPSGKVNWYDDLNEPTPFLTNSRFNAGIILGSRTVFYETEDKGCKSAKVPLTIVMKPRPTAGFTYIIRWKFRVICTPITTQNQSLRWFWGDGTQSTGANGDKTYTSGDVYTIRQVATSSLNGCTDTADITVDVRHLSIKSTAGENLKLFPNPVGKGEIVSIGNTQWPLMRFQILQMDGKIAQLGTIESGNIQLSANLKSGIYMVKVIGKNQTFTQKLLIE